MKSFIAPLILGSLFAFSSMASAEIKDGGIYLEPAITYQTGDTTVTYPGPFSDSTEKVKGLGLGVRLGMHVHETIFLAVDGRYARPNYESSALNGSADADASNLGLTLGAQTPLAGIRVWGTYILTGNLNPQEISGVDVKFNDFKGYRVGGGLYIGSIGVNLEYQDAKYDSTTIEKAGPISGNLDSVKGSDKSYILSVSFPVSL